MRVLLVAADGQHCKKTEFNFIGQGFKVYGAESIDDAVDLTKTYGYDLVLLDLKMADKAWPSVLRTLSSCMSGTQVMVVNGKSCVEDKIKAFHAGAVDYSSLNDDFSITAARARRIILRVNGHAQPTITAGPLQLDFLDKIAMVDGNRVPLYPKTYQILELLMLRNGRLLTREQILDHLYDEMDEPNMRSISSQVSYLRKALRAVGVEDLVETVHRDGFRLAGVKAQYSSILPSLREVQDNQGAKKQHVLWVSDNGDISPIGYALDKHGYALHGAYSGEGAMSCMAKYCYDAVVLDKGVTRDVLCAMRAQGIKTPVMIIGAENKQDVLHAYGLGADDCLGVRVGANELAARMKVVIKISAEPKRDVLALGNLKIFNDSKKVVVNDDVVHLSDKEFHILKLLVARKSDFVTKERILAMLYSGKNMPTDNIISVFLTRLRKKMRKAGADVFINHDWLCGFQISHMPTCASKLNP